MPSQTALVIKGAGKAEVVTDLPFPKLRDEYILVKTVAVALNPIDVRQVDLMPNEGAIVGCDYAGTVEQVGSKVTKQFAKGDRVCGCVHGNNGANHDDGAFAEYVVAKGDIQIKIPENLSFEEGATLGVGIITVGQALYQSLGLPLPSQPAPKPFPVLIYGGSSATGSLAIGFAKQYIVPGNKRVDVVTGCPINFELVKSVGATHCFDYRSPTCAADIRKVTHDRLAHAMDCIATPDTARICCEATGSTGGQYSSLVAVPELPRTDVSNARTMGYKALGEAFEIWGKKIPASPTDFAFAVSFTVLAEELLRDGKIKVHPPGRRPGGLHGILQGLQELREEKISGEKLVYTL
ncbi:MAG: hypothetical protein M1826_002846 [Phylliscum demangeonii]|nr:MAG: hypothetical protein M1826_002846 [Phylliscum demangeonii]